MHGVAGETEGHAPTRPALARLGIGPSATLEEAAARLASDNFAYVGLENFCPSVAALLDLRPRLGVRTVANTFARDLNPLGAPYQLQGIFHPPYRARHQGAAVRLGQPHAAIFKGGGGEVQRTPLKPCVVATVRDGKPGEQEWPATLPDESYRWRDQELDPAHIATLWRGQREDPVPAAAVTATAALALELTGRAATMAEAEAMAAEMWAARPRDKYGI
jgi:anthranilate phosphoribosyltransferase